MNPEHLYIHVPFCARRCGYCDFAVTATRQAPVEPWLNAIEAELRLHLAGMAPDASLRLDTIYIGGGTPSLLGTGALSRLADLLRRYATWDPATVEWTAEANPESFTAALAEDWAAAGVNRISLGAQTFHEPTLRWMGRLHGEDGPRRAVAAARAAGLDNISIDMMFGLPARLQRDWGADLEQALHLGPRHISLYGLTAEPATPLGRHVDAGTETLADEETYGDEYILATERLGAAGYRHYEVSNFAQPGAESRHNGAYWQHRPYLGLGPGAHSFLPPVRFWNVRDWAEYARRLAREESPREGCESLDAGAVALERIWLGLRAADGIASASLSAPQRALVADWTTAGWATAESEAVRLTRSGWLLLDRLAVELEAAGG